MTEETKLFVVESPVSEKTREFFEAAAGDIKSIGTAAADALREVANGGILLTRKHVSQIEQSVGYKVRTAAQIQRNLEGASRRKGGKRVLTWTPDPVYDGTLDEMAQMRGIPVEDILQECVDWVISKGWIFDLTPEPIPLQVTQAEAAYLRSLMEVDEDVPLRGADVVRYLREVVGEVSEPAEVA